MKRLLVIAAALICANGVFAQGTVVNVNNISTSSFRALIYNVEAGDASVQKHGNSSADTPSGSTVYTGGLLAGTGWTIQLWGTGGTVSDPNALTLAQNGTSAFRTGGAAGIYTATTATINNAPGGGGSHATLEVRVWDNKGGTITDWLTASTLWRAGGLAAGTSGLFGVSDLGDGSLITAPVITGLQSFNVSIVPEPSTIALAIAGGIGMLFLRRRNK